MALVIEDGTGIELADSWATVEEADAYAESIGNTAWTASNDEPLKEQALRRAARFIIIAFNNRFAGIRTYGLSQTLPFPRTGLLLADGILLEDDYIPPELIQAQIELALREFTTPGVLTPTTAAQVKQAVQVGPISVTYAESKSSSGVYSWMSIIDGLLFPFLDMSKVSGVAFLKRA
jgi:hypothetical protein